MPGSNGLSFIYDAQGYLLAENKDGQSSYTREYIYLGNMPVVVMQ